MSDGVEDREAGRARPTVVLAAGTCTGAGTAVALVEACRALAAQVAAGDARAIEVRIPAGADEAAAAATGLVVRRRGRWSALLEEIVARGRAEVYIGFADRLPLFGRAGTRQVMVVQNPHLYEASDAPSLGGLRRRVLAAWSGRSARRADTIICATDSSRRAVLDAVGGLDESRLEVRPIRPRTPPPRDAQAGVVGRIMLLGDLYAYKRFDVALDGIRRWAESTGSAPVEVVHCGCPRDEPARVAFDAAVERARTAGLTVTVRGKVSHDAALAELRSSDLMVVASETETQGLTVFEALAVGVPVVARDLGPIREVAGDAYQPVALDGTADDFASAIAALEDRSTRQALVVRGLHRAVSSVGWDVLSEGGRR